MQNLPTPVGSILDTRPQDYDQERFFLVPQQGVSDLKRTFHAPGVFKLHGTLSTCLKDLGEDQFFEWVGSYMSDAVVAHAISQAMTSWVYVGTGADIVPLQFNVFTTEVPQDILHFCFRKGILAYLTTAMDLLEKSFPSIQGMYLEQEHDPETGEEWLTLNFTVKGRVDELLEKYDKYTDGWVSLVPWPDRDRIRVAYNLV